MPKRYQIFISSTYEDLKEERLKIRDTILELNCFPAGMELFPAVDEEQWEFIKKIIDESDYYILLIGGRYGSLSNAEISYTEKEFDYAVSIDLKVMAFIHGNPDELPLRKSERDPLLAHKLGIFREKVRSSRLVKTWLLADELPGLVATSLNKTIAQFPASGWIKTSAKGDGRSRVSSDTSEIQQLVRALQKTRQSGILCGRDITTLVKAGIVGIEPFDPYQISAAAYELRIALNGDPWIEPESLRYFRTIETIKLPEMIVGHVFTTTSTVGMGLSFNLGLQLDPRYTGPVYGTFMNHSKHGIEIDEDYPMLSIEFNLLIGSSSIDEILGEQGD